MSSHFEKIAFKVGKKIFVTLDKKNHEACVKLSEIDQDLFSIAGKSTVFPVPNKWGKQGWTIIKLDTVHIDVASDALVASYCNVASKELTLSYRSANQ